MCAPTQSVAPLMPIRACVPLPRRWPPWCQASTCWGYLNLPCITIPWWTVSICPAAPSRGGLPQSALQHHPVVGCCNSPSSHSHLMGVARVCVARRHMAAGMPHGGGSRQGAGAGAAQAGGVGGLTTFGDIACFGASVAGCADQEVGAGAVCVHVCV